MFILLMLSVVTWMTVGWYVVGGVTPLYPFPLSVAMVLMLTTGRIFFLSAALRNVLVFLFFLAVWVFFSSVFATESPKGASAVLNYLSGIAILMVSYHSIVNFNQIKNALGVYSLVVAAGLALGILQLATGRFYPSEAAYVGGATGFEGMNYAFGKNFIPLMAAGIALTVSASKLIGPLAKRKWLLLCVGGLGAAISGSRSTQFGVIVMTLVAILISRRWNLLWLGGVLIAAFVGLFLTSEKWDGAFDQSIFGVSGGRFSLWGAAFNMIKENPLFGVGAGNFKLRMPQYLSSEGALALTDTEIATSGIAAHNVFIGLAAESGIIACLLYLMFYFYITRLAYKMSRRRASSAQGQILAYAGFIYMVGYFIDMNFHNYGDENTIWFFSGLILALDKIESSSRSGFLKPKLTGPLAGRAAAA